MNVRWDAIDLWHSRGERVPLASLLGKGPVPAETQSGSVSRLWEGQVKEMGNSKRRVAKRLSETSGPIPDSQVLSYPVKNQAEELLEAQALCQSMVRSFDGFIYISSSDYEVEFMNEGLVLHIGANAMGQKCYRALHDLATVCPWCVHDRVQRGETVRLEMKSPTDGRWYYEVSTPIRHSDGLISKMTTIQDITDRKRVARELEEVRRELALRIAERTAALSKSNKMLRREIADRKRTELFLRKSEEKYKELAELVPEIVFEIDSNGKFAFVNCSGLQALGCTAQELAAGINSLDVVIPEDRERLARDMSSVALGERLRGSEYTMRRKDGTVFPALVYCSPITRKGTVAGIRGVAVDIADIRRTEENLWIKNSAIACSMTAIAMADLTGNVTYVNPAFLNMWRYGSPKEVLSKKFCHFWEQRDEVKAVGVALQEKGWWQGELVARREDVSPFDAQVSGTMVTDKSGNPICMMYSVVDVTERNRAEEALRNSEERFRAIFEGARDCIVLKDRTLRYTLVNPAMVKLLGLPASSIVGRKAEDIFGTEAGKRIREVDLRALAGQSVEEEHTKIVRGEPLTFHDVTVPLRNADSAIVGICTISRNITERKKTQPVPRITVRDYPSPAIRVALERARYAAEKDGIVMLLGESGSGKDYLARWIHEHSRRANGPFFAINCAAVPHELAESELFGHEAGAFTGARGRKRGMLELAEGGTLLLNEIGELSLMLQSKLLAFLDQRSFLRVGGEKLVHVNARLMAATHRNLESEVQAGRFLPALFYRLNVFTVDVPPLRRRTEDIPVLVEEILDGLAKEMQLSEIPVIDSHTVVTLKRYLWPGNVRELRNVLERGLMLWDKGDFKLTLPGLIKSNDRSEGKTSLPLERGLHEITDEITQSLCEEALRRTQGNRREAARMLKISRNSLYRYMKRFGLVLQDGTAPQGEVFQ